MAIDFTLVDATQYRLRYLAVQDGVISSPPVEADGLGIIGNDGSPSPDMLTDILSAADGTAGGSPLQKLLDAGRNGYKTIAAGGLTQAQARALLNSDDAAGAVLTNKNVGRAVVTMLKKQEITVHWGADVNVDGSGNPVIEVRSDVGTPAAAYVDLHFRHTDDL
jgi:hypothetical protein